MIDLLTQKPTLLEMPLSAKNSGVGVRMTDVLESSVYDIQLILPVQNLPTRFF
jgi:hypothetical protein